VIFRKVVFFRTVVFISQITDPFLEKKHQKPEDYILVKTNEYRLTLECQENKKSRFWSSFRKLT